MEPNSVHGRKPAPVCKRLETETEVYPPSVRTLSTLQWKKKKKLNVFSDLILIKTRIFGKNYKLLFIPSDRT